MMCSGFLSALAGEEILSSGLKFFLPRSSWLDRLPPPMTYTYPPQYAYPSAPPMYRALPAPPRLHWGWVFGLSVITFGIFGSIWMVVQASWVKKATRNARPFWWCLAYLLCLPSLFLIAVAGGITAALVHRADVAPQIGALVTLVFRIAMIVCYIGGAFSMKNALEAEPIDIPLSGVMTFFFAPFYFQYHLFDYNVEGRVAEQLTGFGEPALAGASAMVADASEVPPQA